MHGDLTINCAKAQLLIADKYITSIQLYCPTRGKIRYANKLGENITTVKEHNLKIM